MCGYVQEKSQDEKENITAEELLLRSAVFENIPLNEAQQRALQNKILKYAVLKAEKGELSGEYKISKYADYEVDEHINGTTFIR